MMLLVLLIQVIVKRNMSASLETPMIILSAEGEQGYLPRF
jgi:hypothetical protein